MKRNNRETKNYIAAVAEGKENEVEMLRNALSNMYLFSFKTESMRTSDFSVLYAEAPYLNHEWLNELWKATRLVNERLGTNLTALADEDYQELSGELETHMKDSFDEIMDELYPTRSRYNG